MHRDDALKRRHWSQHRDQLLQLITQPRFGVISDFDGTLSPFVTRPQDALISPATARALDRLHDRVSVIALVSGRAVADLRSRFPRDWLVYYGNHGMDFWHEGRVETVPLAQRWVEPLQKLLKEFGEPDLPGVILENKGVTASVHYRLAQNPAEARQSLYEMLHPLCARYGLALSEGQFVWEIKPPVKLTKGTAAQAVVHEYRLDSVLFLGDDLTDVDAMRALKRFADDPQRDLLALSVGILHSSTPPEITQHADLFAEGVDDTAALLNWIGEQLPSVQ